MKKLSRKQCREIITALLENISWGCEWNDFTKAGKEGLIRVVQRAAQGQPSGDKP